MNPVHNSLASHGRHPFGHAALHIAHREMNRMPHAPPLELPKFKTNPKQLSSLRIFCTVCQFGSPANTSLPA